MTDTITFERPRRVTAPRPPTLELARVEARRMLRHPAPWAGLLLSAWMVQGATEQDWTSAQYEGFLAAVGPLLLGLSLATVTTFGRGRSPVAEDAPVTEERRSLARLLAGLPLVGVVALVVVAAAVYLRMSGGIRLGDEPGMTLHAQYTLPELLQPVLLGCFAVALGAAVVRVVRSALAAHVLLFVYWFLVDTYWLFNGAVLQALTPLQVQPNVVVAGPPTTDPTTFPSDWLLSAPGEYQDFWGRVVVSPSLAAWHDVYVVALTVLCVAVAVPGRWRRRLLVGGAVVAVVAVAMQLVVTP